MSDQKKSKWRFYITMATFVALGVLIYSLRQQIADVIKELGRINAAALLLIIPLKVINYDSYARLYKDLFKTLGNRVSYWAMYKLSLEFNFVNYANPEVDELLEKGRRTFDINERKKIYFRIQDILADELPYIFLYVPDALPIINSRFHGIEPAPIGIGYNLPEWYVPKEQQKHKIQQ